MIPQSTAGDIKGDQNDMIDKRTLRFMGPAYAYLAMEQAIADAGLDDAVSNERTGLGRIRWPVNQFYVRGPSGCVEGRIAQTHWATCGSKCMSRPFRRTIDRL